MRQLRVQFGALSVGKNYPSNGSKCRKNKKKLGGSTTFLWFEDLNISIIDFEDSFVFFFVFLTVVWPGNNINVKAFGVGWVWVDFWPFYWGSKPCPTEHEIGSLLIDKKNKKNSGCLTDERKGVEDWGINREFEADSSCLKWILCEYWVRQIVGFNLFVKGDSKEICQSHVCLMVGTLQRRSLLYPLTSRVGGVPKHPSCWLWKRFPAKTFPSIWYSTGTSSISNFEMFFTVEIWHILLY